MLARFETFWHLHKELTLWIALGFFLFSFLLARVPGGIIGWLIAKVDAAYKKGDTADDNLLTAFLKFVLAFFIWVEARYGKDWQNKLAVKVKAWVAIMPILPLRLILAGHTDKIIELITKLYALGRQATEKEIAEHEPGTPVPVPAPVNPALPPAPVDPAPPPAQPQ